MKTNVALAVLAAAMLLAMEAATGRIPVNDGKGFDGVDYATMLDDLSHGAPDTKLRPAIVVANRPVYAWAGNAVDGFRLMNYLYAGLLSWLVCVLFDRYAPAGVAGSWIRPAMKAVLIVNLFASIAVAKFAAFNPVLVDLGAIVLILAALVLHISERRRAAAAVTVAAVLAREFALGVVLFGLMRDWRRRVPLASIAAMWIPPLVVWIGWRLFAIGPWSDGGASLNGLRQLTGHLAVNWQDPVYASLFVYFMLTTFGGISLFIFARARPAAAQFVREPEWAGYALFMVAAAAAGKADIWRYLMFLLPVVAVRFALVARDRATTHIRLADTARKLQA